MMQKQRLGGCVRRHLIRLHIKFGVRTVRPSKRFDVGFASPATLFTPQGFQTDGTASVTCVGILVPGCQVGLEPNCLAFITNH